MDRPTHGQTEATPVVGNREASSLGHTPLRILQAGEKVGRYTILGQLGEGGMGVVYAAYDPQLDRKVALKLLRLHTDDGPARLLREAQAMAQVTHLNVVAVYDAGLAEGLVFVAMEFVAGQNLAEWLRAAPRSWREVLRVFREAGQGLVAVHQAGLVHRDFKPENVLIGEDGRCRVTDFGLARNATSDERQRAATRPSPARETGPEREASLLSSSVTQHGTVMGTRSYMAPEQFRGAPPDALTDQFSFAVALYRALYASAPYSPADLESWREGAPPPLTPRLTAGGSSERAPSLAEPVPRWIERTLLPALALRPEERYPTLAALLEALGRDPTVLRRRRLAWAAGLATAAALLGLAAGALRSSYRQQATLCRNSEAELATIWDGPVRQRLGHQFEGTGVAGARDTWLRTERLVDDYAQRWTAMRGEACAATRVAGVQSDAVLSLRMACLDRRLLGLKAFVEVFSQPDPATLERAVQAAQGLTPIDGCADVATLRLPVPPPEDPVVRARVETLRQKLELSNALAAAGKYAASADLAREASAAAVDLHYRPLEAELLERLAHSQFDLGQFAESEKTLQRALVAAAAGGHVELAAIASARMAVLIGSELNRPDWVSWAELARAHIERLGGAPKIESVLETALGLIVSTTDLELARTHFEKALALDEKTERPDSFFLAVDHNNLGWNAIERRDYERALTELHRSVEIRERALGPLHPRVAYPLRNIGDALYELGRYDEARSHYLRVRTVLDGARGLPILSAENEQGLCRVELALGRDAAALECLVPVHAAFERSVGDAHPKYTAGVLDLEGQALSRLGRHEEAIAAHRRALALREKGMSGRRRNEVVASAASALGSTLLEAGRRAEALGFFQKAQALYEGDQVPIGPETLEGLGLWHLEEGQATEALGYFERALKARQSRPSQSPPALARTLTLLGRARLALGRVDEALATLQRAQSGGDAVPLPEPVLAEARFIEAQALWRQGPRSRDEARTLATRVRDEEARGGRAQRVALIDAWLAAHR